MSTSIAPSKPGIDASAKANCMGFTVSPHRFVSPKRSLSRSASAGEYRRRLGSMRIWILSTMAWMGVPVVSEVRSPKLSVGAAAYGSGSTARMSKTSSLISPAGRLVAGLARANADHGDPGAHCLEEGVDALPDRSEERRVGREG